MEKDHSRTTKTLTAERFTAHRHTLHTAKIRVIGFFGINKVLEDKLILQGQPIRLVGNNYKEKGYKLLGVLIDEKLNWSEHHEKNCKKDCALLCE